MARFWCSPDGRKVFVEADYVYAHGLELRDFPDDSKPSLVVKVPAEVVGPPAPGGEAKAVSREELVARFEAKFGKRPHPQMKPENILKALAAEVKE